MSQWWICPWDNQVVIDDASVCGIDCSAIPKNINIIWWHGDHGEILYKDRLAIRERFTDFTPLIRYFDAFIRGAQRAKRPITLEQAKFVKARMLEALLARGRELNLSKYQAHRDNVAALLTVEQIADYDIVEGW